MDDVTKSLKNHYSNTFDLHGPTARGVDWSAGEDAELRYDKMLAVIELDRLPLGKVASLADIGCGYGGLWNSISQKPLSLSYTGIDICENMIEWAQLNQTGAEFIHGDVFSSFERRSFDYVVANGILTQKLETTVSAMDTFAHQLVRRMYELCTVGIAFNVMTTKVNFMADNLYYRNPADFLGWCQTEITPKVRIDHAYRLYEYTIYLYRPE